MGQIQWERKGKKISISLAAVENHTRLEVRLYSQANDNIMEYSDISPYAPQDPKSQTGEVFDAGWGKQEELNRLADQELHFPVVDINLKPGMEGVVRFDMTEPGQYCFNGGFYPQYHNVAEMVRIPFENLEHWDNALQLVPKSNRIKQFYLAAEPSIKKGEIYYEFETLREDWCGRIGIFDRVTDECLDEKTITTEASPLNIDKTGDINREQMTQSLSWAVKYLLDCKNTKKGSPMEGGEFLLYDMAAKTRLRSDWPWIWGPSAQLFSQASEIKEIAERPEMQSLGREALALGEASLKQQILDREHPAYGLVRTTMEPGPTREHGFNNRASAADTLFLVGWGWMPLYNATGDTRFLEASEKVVLSVGKLIERSEGGVIPQAFNLKKNQWDKNMFFESSMSLRGLADFYRATGEESHKKIMEQYAEKLLSAFEREDGLWDAMLYSETGQISPCNFFTKSFGYCVDGLMAVHEADRSKGYLEKALKITSHVLKAQKDDGSWSVRLDRPSEEVGVSDKATALWACLFLRLYKLTGDKDYKKAGMKALEWCMENQYFGDDTVARGGIVGRSWPSGIIYRHWFDMVTTYTVSFYGLALTEALSL